MGLSTKLKAFKAMRQMDNGWQLLLNRIVFPNEPIQMCRYKGLEFITDLAGGDANGARELLTSDEYRRFFPELQFSGPISVLDIGANNGGFPLLLASEGYQIDKLACVELNPVTASRLEYNVTRNFGEAATIVNAAISGDEREIPLPETRGRTSENIYTGKRPETKTSVRGTTLDLLIEALFGDEEIDLCKIDIEGAEFEIFKSGNCDRVKQCRNVLVEIHHFPDSPRKLVIDEISALGFGEVEIETHDDDGHYLHLFKRSDLV
ncbi:MAG: FkbM family methyltransferase [Acidobacteria bacterium]|nr:MAG: FkbM family methyltransferase [Acidobacteriota bacterium]REK01450.1 MAG: FkbM family methyltransferase [Acidobacteriota bacterium]REK45121.1 MAG: FkbM family methyltransferase [Acidobacteriota bacterium]